MLVPVNDISKGMVDLMPPKVYYDVDEISSDDDLLPKRQKLNDTEFGHTRFSDKPIGTHSLQEKAVLGLTAFNRYMRDNMKPIRKNLNEEIKTAKEQSEKTFKKVREAGFDVYQQHMHIGDDMEFEDGVANLEAAEKLLEAQENHQIASKKYYDLEAEKERLKEDSRFREDLLLVQKARSVNKELHNDGEQTFWKSRIDVFKPEPRPTRTAWWK